jgi:hypothetical protein
LSFPASLAALRGLPFYCGTFDVVRRSPYPAVEHTFGTVPDPGA